MRMVTGILLAMMLFAMPVNAAKKTMAEKDLEALGSVCSNLYDRHMFLVKQSHYHYIKSRDAHKEWWSESASPRAQVAAKKEYHRHESKFEKYLRNLSSSWELQTYFYLDCKNILHKIRD